jgi:hypothetical protein
MPNSIAIAALLLVTTLVPAEAQPRPDLSGVWTATNDTPPGLEAAASPILGTRFSLLHDADGITLVRLVGEVPVMAMMPLDGREVRIRIPGRACEADATSIESATLDGERLVLTLLATVPAANAPRTTRNVRRVLRRYAPDTLLVETAVADAKTGSKPAGTIYRRTAERMPGDGAPRIGLSATIAQVAWMTGAWIGTSGALTIEEHWTPPAGGSMLATARTLRAGAMTAFEFLCLSEREGSLVYTAMPNGRTPATDFRLTSITDHSAVFENPSHDFPKVIRYTRRADDALEATVSGAPGQGSQTFVFRRKY